MPTKKKTVTKKKAATKTKKKAATKKTIPLDRPLTSIAQDKKWRREDDARTLAQAEEIKTDPIRLRDAEKEAVIIVKERERQLVSIRKVAKKKI